MTQYRTQEGDMVDWICWKHYGRQSGAVEIVLEANRHLADNPPKLPSGIIIELPEIAESNIVETVNIWD